MPSYLHYHSILIPELFTWRAMNNCGLPDVVPEFDSKYTLRTFSQVLVWSRNLTLICSDNALWLSTFKLAPSWIHVIQDQTRVPRIHTAHLVWHLAQGNTHTVDAPHALVEWTNECDHLTNQSNWLQAKMYTLTQKSVTTAHRSTVPRTGRAESRVKLNYPKLGNKAKQQQQQQKPP